MGEKTGNQTKKKEVRIEKVNQVLMYKGEIRVDNMKWHPNPTKENVLSCEVGLVAATVRLNRCKHLSPKRREMFTSATQSRPMAFQLLFFCHQLSLPTLNSLFIEKFPSCLPFILIKFYLAS